VQDREEFASAPKIGFQFGFADPPAFDSFQKIGFDLSILIFRAGRGFAHPIFRFVSQIARMRAPPVPGVCVISGFSAA